MENERDQNNSDQGAVSKRLSEVETQKQEHEKTILALEEKLKALSDEQKSTQEQSLSSLT